MEHPLVEQLKDSDSLMLDDDKMRLADSDCPPPLRPIAAFAAGSAGSPAPPALSQRLCSSSLTAGESARAIGPATLLLKNRSGIIGPCVDFGVGVEEVLDATDEPKRLLLVAASLSSSSALTASTPSPLHTRHGKSNRSVAQSREDAKETYPIGMFEIFAVNERNCTVKMRLYIHLVLDKEKAHGKAAISGAALKSTASIRMCTTRTSGWLL